jgi:hypothetical protein
MTIHVNPPIAGQDCNQIAWNSYLPAFKERVKRRLRLRRRALSLQIRLDE